LTTLLIARLNLFLLLTLLALQQSCGTNTALQPPSPGPVHQAEKAKPTHESIEAEQDPGTPPQLSMEPVPRESLPESVLGFPEKDWASPGTMYDTVLLARASDTPINSAWQYRRDRQSKIVGFEFSNRGGNRVLPLRFDIDKNLFFTRDFQFRFDDRARQDIHLDISDWAPSRDKQFRLSELMNSVILFFPRTYLPAIVSTGGHTIVTLPTGEEVEFDAETHEVLGGVFAEAPVDLNPNKMARKFAGIDYIGKGVIVRADSRGTDPKLGTIATITSGSPAADCEGTDCKNQCRVPSKELWNQKGDVHFKFSTDEEFDRYLLSRCGFGLPKDDPRFVIASSLGELTN
jgi:hypothetical protein